MYRLTHSDPYQVRFMDHPVLVVGGAVVLALLTLLVLRWLAPLEMALQDALFFPIPCHGEAVITAVEGVKRCGYFPYRESEFWQAVRDLGFKGPLVVVGLASLYWLWPRAKAPLMTPARLAPLVVAASALWVGSIGIVNFVLKPLFGRPRPKHLEVFGRDGDYVYPGTISDQCSMNCSFVSGEASTAFCLILFAFLLPPRWRMAGIGVAACLALFIGLLRVSFGGHFLSDVLMAYWAIVLVALCTAWWLQSASGHHFLTKASGWLNRKRGVAQG